MPTLTIYVSETEYLALAEEGKKQGKKVNEIAQEAIDNYLKEEKSNA